MADRDPLRAEFLMQGLLSVPESAYRTVTLRSTRAPQRPPSNSRGLDWDGWNQTQMLLMMIHNAIVATSGGRSARNHMLKPPGSRVTLSSEDVIRRGRIG